MIDGRGRRAGGVRGVDVFLVSFDVGWFGGCCCFEFGAFLSNSMRFFRIRCRVFRIRCKCLEFGAVFSNSELVFGTHYCKERYFEFGSVPSNPVLFFFRMRCRQSDTGIGCFEFYAAVPSRSIDADDAFNSNSMKFGGRFSFEIFSEFWAGQSVTYRHT